MTCEDNGLGNRLDACEHWLKRLERAGAYIAAASFVVIVCITVLDVLLRYAVHRPLMWAYDFISWYPMVALFFFAISDSWRSGHHVRVDILIRNMADRPRAAFDLLGTAVALSLMLLIGYAGWNEFTASFETGERLTGVIEWPLWPSKLLVPLGAALFCLRLIIDLVRDLLVLAGFTVQPTHLRRTAAHSAEAYE
jgi:TRAP-type C4-dicarboxylate transport system permease small subunit